MARQSQYAQRPALPQTIGSPSPSGAGMTRSKPIAKPTSGAGSLLTTHKKRCQHMPAPPKTERIKTVSPPRSLQRRSAQPRASTRPHAARRVRASALCPQRPHNRRYRSADTQLTTARSSPHSHSHATRSQPVQSPYARPTEPRFSMRIFTILVISSAPALPGFLGSKLLGFSAM